MDNQFLTTPLLTSNNKKNDGIVNGKKDELIKNLELKNNKLKGQIYKIKTIIQEKFSNNQEETPQKRQSIMRSEDNIETLNQELANAYKKIKMYQYQINKMSQGQAAINLSQRTTQIEQIIKEKKQLGEKLKAKLIKEQRLVSENTKKLSNNNKQQEIQKEVKLKTDEVKYLKMKLKQLQQNSQIKQNNLKKQYTFVQKLQTQLLENGFSHGQLQEIKAKIMKKPNNNDNSVQNSRNKFQTKQDIQMIEDRTIDRFRSLQNEVKLLQKMQGDYQKQIASLEEEKKQAVNKNCNSRNKLIQCESEIEKLERQILQLKGKVLPSNMKPLNPLRSVSSHLTAINQTKTVIKRQSIPKNTKQLAHLLKFDEVGLASDKGQRFTDRNILGKSNQTCAVIGMTVYIDNESGGISGVHCIYEGNKKGGIYFKKDKQAKQKNYREQKFVCEEGDVFKSFGGTLNSQDKLQSLSIVTKKSVSHRFGIPKTTNKSFNFDIGPHQVPVCIFGSLLIIKEIGKKQYSLIEHFGVQINKEKTNNSGSLEPQQD